VFTTTTNLFQIYYDKQVNNSSGGNDTRWKRDGFNVSYILENVNVYMLPW
jgi:hypothetical protein